MSFIKGESQMFKQLIAVAGTFVFSTILSTSGAVAEDNERIDAKAMAILEEMSEYLGGADEFSFKGSARYEYVLNTGEKIEYGQNIAAAVKRPKGIHASVDGDVTARRFVFDGKTAAVMDPDSLEYATTKISGDIDTAVRTMIEKHGVTAPLADFLLEDSFKALTNGLDSATYVGIGDIDGTLCHHLAFRHDDRVDFQVWVDSGTTRVPRRFVIVYTSLEGRPEFRANLSDWNFSERFPDGMFSFTPPDGGVEVEFDEAVQRRSGGE
jgi:hypothetical protein